MAKTNEPLTEKLSRLWNSQADEHNQWESLCLDEMLEFCAKIEREECAAMCEGRMIKLDGHDARKGPGSSGTWHEGSTVGIVTQAIASAILGR